MYCRNTADVKSLRLCWRKKETLGTICLPFRERPSVLRGRRSKFRRRLERKSVGRWSNKQHDERIYVAHPAHPPYQSIGDDLDTNLALLRRSHLDLFHLQRLVGGPRYRRLTPDLKNKHVKHQVQQNQAAIIRGRETHTIDFMNTNI